MLKKLTFLFILIKTWLQFTFPGRPLVRPSIFCPHQGPWKLNLPATLRRPILLAESSGSKTSTLSRSQKVQWPTLSASTSVSRSKLSPASSSCCWMTPATLEELTSQMEPPLGYHLTHLSQFTPGKVKVLTALLSLYFPRSRCICYSTHFNRLMLIN